MNKRIRLMLLSLAFIKASLCQLVNNNVDLFDVYSPIYGYDISAAEQAAYLIQSETLTNQYDCFQKCSKLTNCKMISYKQNQCLLLNKIDYSMPLNILNTSPCLFQKFVNDYSTITPYLQNHWPFNNNLNDIVSGMNLYGGNGNSFSKDRLGNLFGALYLNNQYLQAPSGVYFNGDFTVSTWVYPYRIANADRIIDFSNGASSDNVITGLGYNGNKFPFSVVLNGATNIANIMSNVALILNKWQHITFTVKGTTGYYYINGKLTGQLSTSSPYGITRTVNYIGRSTWGESSNTNMLLDDLKIFNKSLSQQEVLSVLNSYY